MTRKHSCARCGRHRSISFLQPIGNRIGLYCPVCRREIEAALRTIHQYMEKGIQKAKGTK